MIEKHRYAGYKNEQLNNFLKADHKNLHFYFNEHAFSIFNLINLLLNKKKSLADFVFGA